MPRGLTVLANLVAIGALSLVLLLPRSRYAWIDEVDPSFSSGAFEEAGDSTVVVAIALGLALVAQLVVLMRKPSKPQRWVSFAILAGGVVIGLLRLTPP